MIEALAALRADGYEHDFSAVGGRLRCGACQETMEAESVSVDVAYRFEGESDPDDEAAVFGVSCGPCGMKGVYVVSYGPSMSADDADIVSRLTTTPRSPGAPPAPS